MLPPGLSAKLMEAPAAAPSTALRLVIDDKPFGAGAPGDPSRATAGEKAHSSITTTDVMSPRSDSDLKCFLGPVLFTQLLPQQHDLPKSPHTYNSTARS